MRHEKNYKIYAIIADRMVFVGKTESAELEPILWRHLRGEIKTTRNHFNRNTSISPKIVILEHIHVDHTIAYRHEISFMRIFHDNGYTLLNSRGMIEDALNIHEYTQKILDELKTVPIEQRILDHNNTQQVKTACENLQSFTSTTLSSPPLMIWLPKKSQYA